MPDAPGDPPGSRRELRDMRHDARARDARPRRGREPGAGRFQAPLRLYAAAVACGLPVGHGRAACRVGRPHRAELDRIGVDLARDPLGRMAVLRPRGALHRPSQSQHVDLDQPRHRRGVHLQRRCHAGAAVVSCIVRLDGSRRRLLRSRRRDHLADAVRPDPRTEGSLADVGCHQVAARSESEECPPHRARRQ